MLWRASTTDDCARLTGDARRARLNVLADFDSGLRNRMRRAPIDAAAASSELRICICGVSPEAAQLAIAIL
jgi:hypothetical protein